MADDIDSILDQVENQLFRNDNNISSTRFSARKRRSEVDPLVDELLEELDPPPRRVSTDNCNSTEVSNKQPSAKTKCFPLLLGAARATLGLSTLQNQRTCDELLCTSCDRGVITLPDCTWTSEVDTLFLRLAAVQPSQLQAGVQPLAGARAYACQCRSITVTQSTQAMPQNLPWVCGKHRT